MTRIKTTLPFLISVFFATGTHAQNWSTAGNAGTSPGSNTIGYPVDGDFMGTTDNSSLTLGTGWTKRAIIDLQNNMCGGWLTAPPPSGVGSCFTWGILNTFAAPAGSSAAFGTGNSISASDAGFATGRGNILTAAANYSTASGFQNFINVSGGFAAGGYNELNQAGNAGAALGWGNHVYAPFAFAAGGSNVVYGTAANSVTFGASNSNYAPFSLVQGQQNGLTQTANSSMALGSWNTVSGSGSLALGYSNYAAHNNSLAIGANAATDADNQFAASFAGGYHLMGGNVLIGKTVQQNTAYKLDVAGQVRADKLTVNTTGADFVFDSSYSLRPLGEVEGYIKQNRHLPGIAPAADMEKNGIELGGSQAKLLQKIEELTLYAIQQDRKIKEQEINYKDQNAVIAEQGRALVEMKKELEDLKASKQHK